MGSRARQHRQLSPSRLVVSLLLPVSLLLGSSCGSPHYAAETLPEDGQLYIDGTLSPVSAVDEEVPYHGTMVVRGAPPAPADPTPENQDDPTLGFTERRIDMPAPAPRAIFPIDFVIEMAIWPFTSDPTYRAYLVLPTREDVPEPSYEPRDLPALIQRAEAMAASR